MRHAVNYSQAPTPAAYTVAEAASYFRISTAGVWRLLRDGDLPRTRIGGRTLVRKIDLDTFLAKCADAK